MTKNEVNGQHKVSPYGSNQRFDLILSDLRNQFGKQSILYAEDLADLLGKSKEAVLALHGRNSLPFPVKKVGGRIGVSIFDVADYLSESEKVQSKKGSSLIDIPPLPTPKNHRQSLGKLLLAFQNTRDFYFDFCAKLEKTILDSEITINKNTK